MKEDTKTLKDCTGNLDEYLQVGDVVDYEIKNYFIEVIPPAWFDSNLIQMGEACSHIGGKPTFSTLRRTVKGWEYRGNCFRGLSYEPERGVRN